MQKLISASQLQQAIVARRKKLRLSQAEVALKLGLSQSRYSQVEADPALLAFDRLLLLTASLGLELHIGIKDEQPQAPAAMGPRRAKW
ncbi:helix-turn-helix domain-containing protein [Propionivibrio dicarboxylicus]|uniref:HTH-type transcriptional regulator / antitoxin HipB n=1 Tax=Propionivibrio dicarboxylicus TaxID=83767 RepID=A0A1G8EMR8_9RHOO|nr:helix-turn-helix transcriptional regulator [Propionivibrio dicarboxylicus]SDH71009.1 HTH-type transcriptional regulator / antitoxin HipB [Propionivibrio dicarboxylicus]